jgi:hypothetical protein
MYEHNISDSANSNQETQNSKKVRVMYARHEPYTPASLLDLQCDVIDLRYITVLSRHASNKQVV